jgi:hypothetical protein
MTGFNDRKFFPRFIKGKPDLNSVNECAQDIFWVGDKRRYRDDGLSPSSEKSFDNEYSSLGELSKDINDFCSQFEGKL